MARKARKPREYLFVDGYNIINSWNSLKKLSDLSLDTARNELVEIMAEYHHYKKIRVIVVFDAHMVKGNSGKRETIKGVKVVYTKENETADQYIEKKLDEIGRVERVRVATSDWMEQQIVLGRGGTRISAREFELEVSQYKKQINEKNELAKGKNDILIGGLSEESLKQLINWRKNG